jgi:hypothetical protein
VLILFIKVAFDLSKFFFKKPITKIIEHQLDHRFIEIFVFSRRLIILDIISDKKITNYWKMLYVADTERLDIIMM